MDRGWRRGSRCGLILLSGLMIAGVGLALFAVIGVGCLLAAGYAVRTPGLRDIETPQRAAVTAGT